MSQLPIRKMLVVGAGPVGLAVADSLLSHARRGNGPIREHG